MFLHFVQSGEIPPQHTKGQPRYEVQRLTPQADRVREAHLPGRAEDEELKIEDAGIGYVSAAE